MLNFYFRSRSSSGCAGVAFFDIGQAFASSQRHKLERVPQVRWDGRALDVSFWPAQRGTGFPLNKKPGDDTSVLGFSAGNLP